MNDKNTHIVERFKLWMDSKDKTSGDWIIEGVKGEFYPCKPDVFELTYDPVDEESDK